MDSDDLERPADASGGGPAEVGAAAPEADPDDEPAVDLESEDDMPLFAGGSPRWREVSEERGTEIDRRARDEQARTEDTDGAIERDGGSSED